MCFKYLCRSTLQVCGGFANIARALLLGKHINLWEWDWPKLRLNPFEWHCVKLHSEQRQHLISAAMTMFNKMLHAKWSTASFFSHSGMWMDGRWHVQQLRIELNGTLEPFCSAGLSPSNASFVWTRSQLAAVKWQLNTDLIIGLMDAPINHLTRVKPASNHHKLMSGFPANAVWWQVDPEIADGSLAVVCRCIYGGLSRRGGPR